MNLIKIIEKHEPAIMEAFNCEATQWAAFDDVFNEGVFKLLRVEHIRDEVFNLKDDPIETTPLETELERLKFMSAKLDEHLAWANARATGKTDHQTSNLHDKDVMERMRRLGYIE